MDILEHLGMKVPDIESHGVIISRANSVLVGTFSMILKTLFPALSKIQVLLSE